MSVLSLRRLIGRAIASVMRVIERKIDQTLRGMVEPLESRQYLTATPLYWDPNGAAAGYGGPGMWTENVPVWSTEPDGAGGHVAWNGSSDYYGVIKASGAGVAGTITVMGTFGSTVSGATTTLQVLSSGYKFKTNANAPITVNGTLEFDIDSNQSIELNASIAGNIVLSGGSAIITKDLGATGISPSTTSVTVSNSASVEFRVSQALNALSLGQNGKAQIKQGGARLLDIQSLSIDSSSQFDLQDNSILIRSTDTTNTTRNGVWSEIVAGMNDFDNTGLVNWNGNGIVSKTTRTKNEGQGVDAYTIGVISNHDLAALAADQGTALPYDSGNPWLGTIGSVGANDILVTPTIVGDTNLDKAVTIDDFNNIDNTFSGLLPSNYGWVSGDFGFDGVISIDDFNAIDLGYSRQELLPAYYSISGLGGSITVNSTRNMTIAVDSGHSISASAIFYWRVLKGPVDDSELFDHSEISSQAFDFTPTGPGTYTIFLYESSPEGETVASATVNVINHVPVVSISNVLPVVVAGQSTDFPISVTDEDADDVLSTIIDWGDGTPPESIIGPITLAAHTYTTSGNYTLAAMSTDGYSDTVHALPQMVTVDPAPVLDPPSNVTVSGDPSTNEITITWTDNSTDEAGFIIEMSLDGKVWTEIHRTGPNETSYTATGLPTDVTIYFSVSAFFDDGTETSISDSAEGSGSIVTIPVAPSGLSAVGVTTSEINLFWSDDNSNESGYSIEISAGGGSPFTTLATTLANATGWSVIGLSASTTYSFQVRAVGAAGISDPSNVVTGTTLDLPGVPPIDLYNTGMDSDGNPLAPGSTDPNWGGFVVLETSFPMGAWGGNTASSKWIGPDADQSDGLNNEPGWSAGTQFSLPDPVPENLTISANILADNSVESFLINGHELVGTGGFDLTPYLVGGSNSIEIVIGNSYQLWGNAVGMRAEFSVGIIDNLPSVSIAPGEMPDDDPNDDGDAAGSEMPHVGPVPAAGTDDTATFTVTRSGDLTNALTVQLHAPAGTAIAGTTGSAGSTEDYTGYQSSVTIPAGKASAEIVLVPIADNLREGDESVQLILKADSAYHLANVSAEGVIHDVPAPPNYTVDVDIDSDNNNGSKLPDRTKTEERIEDDSTKPGKIVAVNNDDTDGDGIPGWADGFAKWDNTPDYAASVGTTFTPVVFEVDSGLDLSQMTFSIQYDASNPNNITRVLPANAGDPTTYALPVNNDPNKEFFRLWTKDGMYMRDVKAFNASGVTDDSKGWYVPSGSFGAGDWSKLAGNYGGSSSQTPRTITLYLEALKPSTAIGNKTIKFEVDADGTGPQAALPADQVRVTAIDVDVLIGANDVNDDSLRDDWVGEATPSLSLGHRHSIDNFVRVRGPAGMTQKVDITWRNVSGGGTVSLMQFNAGTGTWVTTTKWSDTITIGANGIGAGEFLINGGTKSNALDDITVVGALPNGQQAGSQTITVFRFNAEAESGGLSNIPVNPAYANSSAIALGSNLFGVDVGDAASTPASTPHNSDLAGRIQPRLISSDGNNSRLSRKFGPDNIEVVWGRVVKDASGSVISPMSTSTSDTSLVVGPDGSSATTVVSKDNFRVRDTGFLFNNWELTGATVDYYFGHPTEAKSQLGLVGNFAWLMTAAIRPVKEYAISFNRVQELVNGSPVQEISNAEIDKILDTINLVWSQANVKFRRAEPTTIVTEHNTTDPHLIHVEYDETPIGSTFPLLMGLNPTDAIDVYFTHNIFDPQIIGPNENLFGATSYRNSPWNWGPLGVGIALFGDPTTTQRRSVGAIARTLAHELGHYLLWQGDDPYHTNAANWNIALPGGQSDLYRDLKKSQCDAVQEPPNGPLQ